MTNLLKVMERECLHSEHAAQCFLNAKRRENKRMKNERETKPAPAIEFHRADPAELARFDPATKRCTMNCGPSRKNPRTDAERKFLCDDCVNIAD